MIYNLSWKFVYTKQNISGTADNIADKMTDNTDYWSKIEEILNAPEADQYLESLGIEHEGRCSDIVAYEIATHHFHQLTEPVNEYLEEICNDFEVFMTNIFINEIITCALNEFEIDAIDYEDKTSVSLDFIEDIGEVQIKRFIRKIFKENREAYNPDYIGNFYYEISCPINGYIPFKLSSQEAYNKILLYLLIEPDVKEVKKLKGDDLNGY